MPRISRRTFVAAPADVVWSLAGDFSQWHPKLRIYADGPEAPAELVVTVVEKDDEGMTLSYHMPDPPFPIKNHRATILVEDAGHACAYVTWSAEFTAEPTLLAQLEDSIGDDVFAQALDNLATAAQDSFGAQQVAQAN
ncbi:SRPBCC family protein [Aeromicrobium chenweiae]|uniref:SRPBCC family protein n=1 Tax=Aeromicrobium chenweiae TaxID=2079793 RepID=A0A2S0WKT7_9ACTN|nr:SRPBCC family protein [Aeromicrobium chenweiae]AWB91892.1 SRPBCC family protein [Aeromicrobium chenweiae]TGN32740.1 SRPBCC family protein [Aeromicrobium chenweiae]